MLSLLKRIGIFKDKSLKNATTLSPGSEYNVLMTSLISYVLFSRTILDSNFSGSIDTLHVIHYFYHTLKIPFYQQIKDVLSLNYSIFLILYPIHLQKCVRNFVTYR